MEPSFLRRPLDRYETSLLLLRAVIPRNVLNLWIAMGLVRRVPASVRTDWLLSRQVPTNMQESKEHRLGPLLVVVLARWGGCLKCRRFAENTRHLYRLLGNTVTYSQGYQQKMGNENSYATLMLEGMVFGRCAERTRASVFDGWMSDG